MAPLNGLARVLGVPITVICGPPTSVSPASGVATSIHESSARDHRVAAGGIDHVVDTAAVPMPDWPPNATAILSVLSVVLVKLSSQRP